MDPLEQGSVGPFNSTSVGTTTFTSLCCLLSPLFLFPLVRQPELELNFPLILLEGDSTKYSSMGDLCYYYAQVGVKLDHGSNYS